MKKYAWPGLSEGRGSGTGSRTIVRRVVAASVVALVGAALLAVGGPASGATRVQVPPPLAQQAAAHPGSFLSLIVRERDPRSPDAERAVRSLGGRVTRELPIIGAFSARIPGRALPSLVAAPSVSKVWGNGTARVTGLMSRYDTLPPNTVWPTAIGIPKIRGLYDGTGVTVAMVDTGVIDSPDIGSRLLARVDLTPDHDGVDRFGHGTHMAGIILGNGSLSGGKWAGVATNANLVSVKVAGADGSTDVSEVIAGLQWVYSHRAQYGIRVLNLSFGTDSTQSYLVDPLDYAVERLWKSGIFVVVAAGNRGPDAGTISKPGDDAFVATVGAADLKNTLSLLDDGVASFSSLGPTVDGLTKPDLVAPSISIASIRAPGSTIDICYPDAVVDTNYFKGTGTSQAAAMTSGVAALMFQANPGLTPNVAKATLMGTASKYLTIKPGAGQGLLNAFSAAVASLRGTYFSLPANVGVAPSLGTGSIDASRGTAHAYADLNGDGTMERIAGEVDVLGHAWNYNGWGTNWAANTWESNSWNGYQSVGTSWGGSSWAGTSWDGNSWDGNSWDGNSWDGVSWDSVSWDGGL